MSKSWSSAEAEQTAALSLGSNVGERESSILNTVDTLGSTGGIELAGLSSLYETEPVGNGFSRNFINAVSILKTGMTPDRLLALCREIEASEGRDHRSEIPDRIIDIDILVYGEVVVDKGSLIIPHPRMRQRLFVLEPFSEIAPGMIIPPLNRTVRELRDKLTEGDMVRLISSRRIRIISMKG